MNDYSKYRVYKYRSYNSKVGFILSVDRYKRLCMWIYSDYGESPYLYRSKSIYYWAGMHK